MPLPFKNSIILDISISREVMNDLKYKGIMLSNNSSYICTYSTLITDMYGNMMEPILCSNPKQSASYITDQTHPKLTQFQFSLNATVGHFTLQFDEPILLSSLNFSSLTLLGINGKEIIVAQSSILSYSETSSAFIVNAMISESETDYLKVNDVCRNSGGCFCRISSTFAKDLTGNEIESGVSKVFSYVPDLIRPNLISLELDLNAGYLTLHFDEPVNSQSFNVTEVELLATP